MTPADRVADTIRFYDLLDRLDAALGGMRTLAACDGRMDWPRRGIYFFFEPSEVRSQSGGGARVVRIGTHALNASSRSTLWGRLAQHRGPARHPGGNHRGSIFRLLVGTALAQRGDCVRPASWGAGASLTAAAQQFGTTPDAIKNNEAELERCVSATIGRMPFLWLAVPDAPGRHSERRHIERNTIALLSHAFGAAADPPSPNWLGRYSDRPLVRTSGLWNNNHVREDYDAGFLDTLGAAIAAVAGRRRR